MDVAATLLEARRHAGFSQRELARRGGTSQATLSQYERGLKQPSVAVLARLLGAAGWSLAARPDVRRRRTEPSAEQLERTGRRLAEVIELAELLPTRHERELRFPRLPTAA